MSEAPDLGPCCACGEREPRVRNMVCLPFKAATPGFGWGCVVCDLPPDGAMAVLCDICAHNGAEPFEVCDGPLAEQRRVSVDWLSESFGHNLARHPELV